MNTVTVCISGKKTSIIARMHLCCHEIRHSLSHTFVLPEKKSPNRLFRNRSHIKSTKACHWALRSKFVTDRIHCTLLSWLYVLNWLLKVPGAKISLEDICRTCVTRSIAPDFGTQFHRRWKKLWGLWNVHKNSLPTSHEANRMTFVSWKIFMKIEIKVANPFLRQSKWKMSRSTLNRTVKVPAVSNTMKTVGPNFSAWIACSMQNTVREWKNALRRQPRSTSQFINVSQDSWNWRDAVSSKSRKMHWMQYTIWGSRCWKQHHVERTCWYKYNSNNH